MTDFLDHIRDGYDAVATDYAIKFSDELDHKPLDRALLDRLVVEVGTLGPICDLGCGPGHVAHYLSRRKAQALGIDLSPRMVAEAHRRYPRITFTVGNLLALDAPDASWGGIAAFYSLIHVPRAHVDAALAECRRVLKPGGWFLSSVHLGQADLHLDEWWGRKVNLDFALFRRDEFEHAVSSAGFTIVKVIDRAPIEQVEHPTQRLYVLAQAPLRSY
jgi:SAM-dependent methyltransferase